MPWSSHQKVAQFLLLLNIQLLKLLIEIITGVKILNIVFFMFNWITLFLCFHILFLFLFSFFISIFIFVFKFCFELIFWQDATINLPFFPPYFFHLFLSWKIFSFLLYLFCFMSSFATFFSQFLINFFHFFPLLIHVSHSYFICVFIDLI